MWRALAGLAAMLSGCATTPTPAHPAEGEKYKPPSGDNINWPTQATVSERVGEAVRGNCSAGADAGARYGMVEVIVRRGPEGRPLIEIQQGNELSEADRTCVSSEAYQAVESLRREWGPADFWEQLGMNVVTFSVTLGTAPLVPAFPPPEF